jgi:hypothetical protein
MSFVVRADSDVRLGAIPIKRAISVAVILSPSSSRKVMMSLTNRALFVIERNLNTDLSLDRIAGRCEV